MDDSYTERRKEPPIRVEHPIEPKAPIHENEPKKENLLGIKRSAETPLEPVVEAKKPCVKETPLEDDLSEISDDADEILNRDEVNFNLWNYPT